MDVLPLELCIRILSELPITSAGVHALARCTMTGMGTLHAASQEPHLWKPHYEHRYAHSDREKELERRTTLGQDWRQLYLERRRLDRVALENLRALEGCPPEKRVDYARRIVNLGLDIWDALSIEVNRPLPTLFHEEEDIEKVKDGSPLTNLTRRYWASEVRRIITMRHAIDRWISLAHFISGDLDIEPVSFEEAFASLSSFHGVPPDEIVSHIDIEVEDCREDLSNRGISYTPGAEEFDIKNFCNAVCTYMRSKGFGRAADMAFYDFRNSLPHLFLTSFRRALPISLVFVFVAIVKRLGFQASALNTPNCVTALVSNTLVNVSRMPWEQDSTLGIVENYEDVRYIFDRQALITAQLLARVGRNITIAGAVEFGNEELDERYVGRDVYMWLRTKYLSETLLSIFPETPGDSDGGLKVIATNPTLFPLDRELVLQDKLLLFLSPSAMPMQLTGDREANAASLLVDWSISAPKRPDELFVGQIVMIEGSSMLRCIVGWKNNGDKIVCLTTSCRHHSIKSAPLKAVKHTLCTTQDLRGFLQNPILGQFFEGAEFQESGEGSDIGRGRFIMNKRLMKLYPEDDARGTRWVRGEA